MKATSELLIYLPLIYCLMESSKFCLAERAQAYFLLEDIFAALVQIMQKTPSLKNYAESLAYCLIYYTDGYCQKNFNWSSLHYERFHDLNAGAQISFHLERLENLKQLRSYQVIYLMKNLTNNEYAQYQFTGSLGEIKTPNHKKSSLPRLLWKPKQRLKTVFYLFLLFLMIIILMNLSLLSL